MNRTDFYYELPQELIAQTPLADRSASRLMRLNRSTGEVSHDTFNHIAAYLNAGDCLVLNDTRVIPARLYGTRTDSVGGNATGGGIEFLLLHKHSLNVWEVILKPGRRAKIGSEFEFGGGRLRARVLDIVNDGNRIVEFSYDGVFEHVLDELGEMPLPHYITEKLQDKERYQTVYSRHEGSAAAPTAGLHFTPQLLDEIRAKGIDIAYVTLHVGLGTFRPVKADDIVNHKMHSEFYTLPQTSADTINAAKRRGARVVAVGTTANRVLETVADNDGIVQESSGWTDIFIYPGYTFKCVDALITNFHLPESTLIMLISAFAGREHVLNAYDIAVREHYRFFSFGDSMMIS